MRVSLTGKAAWQLGGPTPADTEWDTVECDCGLCQSGRFVAVNQRVEGYDGWRHVTKAALREFHPFGTDAFPPPEAYGLVPKKSSSPRRRRRSTKS